MYFNGDMVQVVDLVKTLAVLLRRTGGSGNQCEKNAKTV
jgi:hypothetical protein